MHEHNGMDEQTVEPKVFVSSRPRCRCYKYNSRCAIDLKKHAAPQLHARLGGKRQALSDIAQVISTHFLWLDPNIIATK